MASFAGTKIKDTYGNVLQVANSNNGVDGTLRTVDDGKGDASALKISTGAIQVDNIKVDGNTISSTDTDGNISLTPNGSGSVAVPSLELGHASDTTITRASSGDLAIEGNAIYRAGGTDVPVADGGTGASTLSSGQVLLGNGTSAIQSRAIGIANDNIVEIDHASVADNDYAKFTGNGLEGRSYSEVLSDIGAQASLTFGIANTNAVKIDHASVADDDYAKFTANGVEGRSYAEVKTDLSLNNVENTAISSFAGTSNITTTGALDSGSISSGFGNIDNGTSTLDTGAITATGQTIQNSGNALLQLISESSDGDSVSAVTLTRNNNSNQVANLGVRDNENILRITTGSNVGPSFANLGNFTRLAINDVGDGIFMTSTGVGRIGANTISVGDDTTVSIAGAGEGAICHIYVYERGNGAGAIFTANYHGLTKLVTQDNPISDGSNPAYNFAISSTDGSICLYKSESSHTITFENKTGDTRVFKIMIVGAGQAPVI
tara:strand:- start:585 stop:2060 length:1476 start_codon:yes stop_codon:yes gene_type:complete